MKMTVNHKMNITNTRDDDDMNYEMFSLSINQTT